MLTSVGINIGDHGNLFVRVTNIGVLNRVSWGDGRGLTIGWPVSRNCWNCLVWYHLSRVGWIRWVLWCGGTLDWVTVLVNWHNLARRLVDNRDHNVLAVVGHRLTLDQLRVSHVAIQGWYRDILVGVTGLIPGPSGCLASGFVRYIWCPVEGNGLNIVWQNRLAGRVDEVNGLLDVDGLGVLSHHVVLNIVDIHHQVTRVVIKGNTLHVGAVSLVSWCDQGNMFTIDGW